MSINFLSNLIIIFKQDIRLSMLHCVFLLFSFFWFYKFCIVSLKVIWKKIVHSCKYLHSEPELQKHKSEIACLKSNQFVPICVSRHIYEWICRYICLRFSFLSCKQYPLSPLWFLHIIISITVTLFTTFIFITFEWKGWNLFSHKKKNVCMHVLF